MKRLYFILLILISSTLSLFANKKIKLQEPYYIKHASIYYIDITIELDDLGRIVYLQASDDPYFCTVDYKNFQLVINPLKENSGIESRRYDLNEYNISASNSKIEISESESEGYDWVFENGILFYKEQASNNIEGYYIYRKKDSFYELCYFEYMGLDSNKAFYISYGYDYKYPFEAVNKLKSKDFEINRLNAIILQRKGLVTLVPFILADSSVIATPKSYSASSELKEKNAFYKAENLRTVDGLPWASANGYGINDKITIVTPTGCSMSLDFYNGYQSETRKDLYKANSRAKKIRIKSLESEKSIEIDLKDTPEVQTVSIDKLNLNYNVYTNLEITILEVYPGDKYKDLCIQAIIPVY